jgi:hypothetical protein
VPGVEGLDQLTWLLSELNAKQQLLTRLLRWCGDGQWTQARPVGDPAYAVVSGRGHFPYRPAELAWAPQVICGHLIDTARQDAERIRILRHDDTCPDLPWFDEDDPVRHDGYRRLGRQEAYARLADAQQALLFRAASVQEAQVDRVGACPSEGIVNLREVLTAATEHLADHAHQLAVLLGRR